jgi:tetratricopeptide (TPR) repeat protein
MNEPSQKQIADLFTVVYNKSQDIDAPVRKTRGDTAEESNELGTLSLTEGDYEKAIEHFRRAVEQSETVAPEALINLAGAYEFADMAPQALRQYEKALRIQSDSTEPRLGLSQLYKRNARYKESLQHLEQALKVNPRNAFMRFKMAEILREIGERDAALVAAQLAVAAGPSDSFYHYWYGDLLIEAKQYEEALGALRAAIELSPGDDYLYLKAAIAFWGAGKRQEAVKSVRLASDLDPDKHLYHGLLELLLSEMELNEEADLEAERSSQMDDYDRDALHRIADSMGLEV